MNMTHKNFRLILLTFFLLGLVLTARANTYSPCDIQFKRWMLIPVTANGSWEVELLKAEPEESDLQFE